MLPSLLYNSQHKSVNNLNNSQDKEERSDLLLKFPYNTNLK